MKKNFSSARKVVETTYAKYQGLSKIQLCKVYVGRKSTTRQSSNFAKILPLHVLPHSPLT